MTSPRIYQKGLYEFHEIVFITGCYFCRRNHSVFNRLRPFVAVSSTNQQCFKSARPSIRNAFLGNGEVFSRTRHGASVDVGWLVN